jgi:hypothetical protein
VTPDGSLSMLGLVIVALSPVLAWAATYYPRAALAVWAVCVAAVLGQAVGPSILAWARSARAPTRERQE